MANGSSRAAETTRTTEIRASYAELVPDCRAVMGAGYPFGTGADLQPTEVSRVAGLVDNFGSTTLQPYLRRDGAIWNWAQEPTVRGFAANSARTFQRAEMVKSMMAGNLVLKFSTAPGGKRSMRLRASGVPIELVPGAPGERFNWSSGGLQSAEFQAVGEGAGPPVRQEGPWALFRLLDTAKKQQLGPGRYRFTFGADMPLDVEVVSGPNPFSADGPFALRCPDRL